MSRFRGPYGLTIWPLLLALVWAASCARPAGLQGDDAAAQADPHSVPFHNGAEAAHPTESSAHPGNPLKPETGLPFEDSPNLPAGTLLTVRLKNPITAENLDANLGFEAIVDDPIVIEGNKLVPRGVTVSGRVESTRSSNLKRNRGSVRLTLDAMHLAAATVPIQTSSLFARGRASDANPPSVEDPQSEDSNTVIRLERGRRLTFRLSESVYVAASHRTQADH